MKKKTILFFAAAALSLGISAKANADTQMQRLYSPNSGEHFYTANMAEKNNLVAVGWSYEGIGWVAPDSGESVYRLYNPNAGDHHYTKNAAEKDQLIAVGWSYEGVSWYSGGSVPLYRAYSPNAVAGSHNYSSNSAEQSSLISVGWNDEGIAWNGVAGGIPIIPSTPAPAPTPSPAAGGQYYQASDRLYHAARGMVFVNRNSGIAYTRVSNPANYNYVAWANQRQPANGGNGDAQFVASDL